MKSIIQQEGDWGIFEVVEGKFKGLEYSYIDGTISNDNQLAFAFDFRNKSAEKFISLTTDENFDIIIKEWKELIGKHLLDLIELEQYAAEETTKH